MILDLIEQQLNRGIVESTAAQECARQLEHKSLAIEIDGLSVRVVLSAERARLRMVVDNVIPTSATLKAGPVDLLRLIGSDKLGDLKGAQAELSGEIHVADSFAALLHHARPDPEEELSRWIGDIAAHEIAAAARGLADWTRRSGRALEMNAGEYLQEESEILPATLCLQSFYADVERLSEDVDRAAQRLARLGRTR